MTPGDLLTIQHREGVTFRLIEREHGPHPYEPVICDLVYVEGPDQRYWFPESWVVGVRPSAENRWKSAPPDTGPRVVQSLVDRPERWPTE